MRDVILHQADQIRTSLEKNKDVKVEGQFDSMILAGMGGSGHPGDLLNALGITKKPLFVHRNYDLPLDYMAHMGLHNPLVIISSYSGNTEESLSGYKVAKDNNLTILVSASGGKLKELCERDHVSLCMIDFPGMQPRHTLFAAFTGIATALSNSGLAEDISPDLRRVADTLEQSIPNLEEQARMFASRIKNKVPVFTSSDNLGFATKNFKIQTNENAKHPAFWNTFPELNHNEMLGFSKLKESGNRNQFIVLLIRDPLDHPRNKARLDVTKELYRSWGVEVEEFTAQGQTLLEKIFHTVTFGLWTTYYLAQELGIDPVPVEGVENFKARLKEIAGDAQ